MADTAYPSIHEKLEWCVKALKAIDADASFSITYHSNEPRLTRWCLNIQRVDVGIGSGHETLHDSLIALEGKLAMELVELKAFHTNKASAAGLLLDPKE
jgi:hypothetical protein